MFPLVHSYRTGFPPSLLKSTANKTVVSHFHRKGDPLVVPLQYWGENLTLESELFII